MIFLIRLRQAACVLSSKHDEVALKCILHNFKGLVQYWVNVIQLDTFVDVAALLDNQHTSSLEKQTGARD